MRSILIDWLVEVHLKFKLLAPTLFLTINVLDRFLESTPIARNKLQLAGVSALLVASKYEEIYPPEIADLVYMTDKAYTKPEIIKMEQTILAKVGFTLGTPSICEFTERFLKIGSSDKTAKNLSYFISERMLQEMRMLSYAPSIIAASGVCLARQALQHDAWVRV
jgi:cyclin B